MRKTAKVVTVIGHVAAALVAAFLLFIVSFIVGLFYRVTYLNTLTTQVGWAFILSTLLYISGLLLTRLRKRQLRRLGYFLCVAPLLFILFFFRYAYLWCPF